MTKMTESAQEAAENAPKIGPVPPRCWHKFPCFFQRTDSGAHDACQIASHGHVSSSSMVPLVLLLYVYLWPETKSKMPHTSPAQILPLPLPRGPHRALPPTPLRNRSVASRYNVLLHCSEQARVSPFPLSLRPLLLLLLLLLPLALELLLELLEELDELEPLLLLDLDADLDRERTAIVPCLRPKV